MPKMKSNSGAKKRFRLTGTGKVRFKRAKRNHILTKKTTKLKRHLRRPAVLADADAVLVKRLIPYAK